jgi:hypothetical protein
LFPRRNSAGWPRRRRSAGKIAASERKTLNNIRVIQ